MGSSAMTVSTTLVTAMKKTETTISLESRSSFILHNTVLIRIIHVCMYHEIYIYIYMYKQLLLLLQTCCPPLSLHKIQTSSPTHT